MKKIIVQVSPEGEITVQTKGYTGPACKEASRAIEEALGIKTAEALTAEYHQKPSTGTSSTNNQTA